jgi:tryptophan synthase beta subunit
MAILLCELSFSHRKVEELRVVLLSLLSTLSHNTQHTHCHTMSTATTSYCSSEWQTRIEEAHTRIEAFIHRTPLDHALWLSNVTGSKVLLKNEHHQRTGSFKVRGALNKLLTLSVEQRQRGVIAASTGNHGLAVAYAGMQCWCV